MDYEKKYKEVLERARQFSEKPYLEDSKGIVEYIFPELAESEDEMIRKKVIDVLKLNVRGAESQMQASRGVDRTFEVYACNKVIAWLEKQGKNNMGISEATKQKLEDNLNKALEKETAESFNEFLDEQGEQNTDEYIEVKGLSEIEAEADELIKEMSGEKHNLTDFERTLADICIGWIGEEPGWVEYIRDNADVLLKIAVKMFNSVQDVPFEQKPAPKHKVGDTIYYNSFGKLKSMIVANVVTDSTDNPMYEDKEGNAVFEKDLVEQKPAEWSEEDEEIHRRCICAMRASACGFPEEEKFVEQVDNWLKALKDRYTWKPSDEQMGALSNALSLAKNCGEDYSFDLRELLEQLKAL